jgi:hypothetical protein
MSNKFKISSVDQEENKEPLVSNLMKRGWTKTDMNDEAHLLWITGNLFVKELFKANSLKSFQY